MLLADVNLFIHAHRPESPRFAEHHAWLTNALTGDEPFGVFEQILSNFLRSFTNHPGTPPGGRAVRGKAHALMSSPCGAITCSRFLTMILTGWDHCHTTHVVGQLRVP